MAQKNCVAWRSVDSSSATVLLGALASQLLLLNADSPPKSSYAVYRLDA